MVLLVGWQEAGPVAWWPKTLKERVGKQLQEGKGSNKNSQSDNLKQESTYTFQGMMTKGDDEDDKSRTTPKPQVRVAVK